MFFTQFTFNLFCLLLNVLGISAFSVGFTPLLNYLENHSFPKDTSNIWKFPVKKKKLVWACFMFRSNQFYTYAKIANETTHACTLQDITQQSHLLQPYPKQDVVQHILF
jgi:hypothetical protein